MQVQGHKNYGDLQQFVSTIKFNLRGLKNVYERNTAGGVATLDLKILGTGAQLARELANKDLAPFTVDIVNVSPNRVDIKIKQQAAEMESISTTPDSTNQ